MGIDPGTHTTGYGLISKQGSRLIHIDNGLICAPKKAPLHERLAAIQSGLSEVLDSMCPHIVSIEDVFVGKNARAALSLGHARGVALATAALAGLEVVSYAPKLVKKTVAGTGRADKHQVQMMVKTLLGLPEVPAEDAADALALAICHCHHARGAQALDRLITRHRR
jgi:crossover junction endodeoxyribonuclease RuvC